MATLETTTERFRTAVSRLNEPLEHSILIDLGAAGVIRIEGNEVDNENLTSDLVVTVSPEDFRKLGSGELDAMVALMTGRLRLSNMQLAMTLRPRIMEMFQNAR